MMPEKVVKNLFENDENWKRFEDELLSWLGTPYRHLQNAKGRGADCTLFVAQAMVNSGFLLSVEYDYYPRDWHIHTTEEFVLESLERHIKNNLPEGIGAVDLTNDDALIRGDLIMYATTKKNVTNHCAIVLDEFDGRCQMTIHSINYRGVSRFPLGRTWKRKQRGGFRFVEI